MSIFGAFKARVQSELGKYKGDPAFLKASCAASALVIAADGQIDDTEIEAALNGLMANDILKSSYRPSEIDAELTAALTATKTRAGKLVLMRELDAVATKPQSTKEDIFMIAADVADDGGIGEKEGPVLDTIAKALGLDAKRLLAA